MVIDLHGFPQAVPTPLERSEGFQPVDLKSCPGYAPNKIILIQIELSEGIMSVQIAFGDLLKSIFEMPPIRLSMQDLERTTYPSASFDFITSLSVIEHGVNLENYFKEMNRLLKKGGYLITSADYWPDKVDTEDTGFYGLKWSIFDRKEIEAMVRLAGKFGFALTEPVDFAYKNPVIELKGKRYTFIFFVLQKKGIL